MAPKPLTVSLDGSPGMGLGLAVQGQLRAAFNQVAQGLRVASTGAMRDLSAANKAKLRADAAVLGKKLANAWRVDVFPRTGVSDDPAVVMQTKAPLLITVFSYGVTITAQGSKWLAVPTPDMAGRIHGGKVSMGSNRAKAGWIEGLARQLSPADPTPHFWIERGADHGMIYVVNPQYRIRTVIGWLVRKVVIGKKFEGKALFDRLAASFPTDFLALFDEYADAELSA